MLTNFLLALALQWSIPNGIEISAECRDLLTRMLVRNPDERITMAEIHRHPWFIANLPVEVRCMRSRGAATAALCSLWCAGCWLLFLS
jgi:serine/threonine protein kinase